MSFYGFARGLVKLYYRIVFRVKAEGLENLEPGRNYVVCPNHKSLNDPPLLGTCVKTSLRFMAKEELFENKLFGALISVLGAFPVKRGEGDLAALKAAIKLLKDGENLVIFPEGARSPKEHLHKGKSGAVLIAVKAGVDIVPVGICGTYKLFSKMTVRFGKPIRLGEYFGKRVDSDTLQDITDNRLMPAISELSGVPTYEDKNCG
ncbi:MAG: lysophospholipid acyltransferase family protein [Clostridia bacterium]|nr:lysophospholipid acyltransferase family protein [Clostridia bacterium]